MTELAQLRSRVAELELSESTQRPIWEALRESEMLYRRLFEAARDGILMLDADTGAITAVNPFLTDLLGYSEQEILGKKLWEIGPFKDKRISKIAFQELQTQEYIRYEDLPLETKDGGSIAVEFVSNVYVAGQKKVIQCNIRDITERKQAQKASEEAEERYRALFENMLDGYAHCQMLFEGNRPQDFIYLAVNTAFETLTGLQNVIGRRVTEVIPSIKETAPELLEIYGRVARSGQPERFEYWLKPLEAWFDISVYGAQEGCFVAVFDNITKRKWAEQALQTSESNYRTLIESAADGIIASDAQGHIDDANPMACRMLAYTREEVLGLSIGDLLAPEDVARVAPAMARISEGEVMRNEWQLRRKDGTLFPGEVSATMLPGGRVLGIVRDITERKRAEAQRELLAALIEASPDFCGFADSKTAHIQYINKGGRRMCGIGEDEDVGKLKISDVHPAWMNKRMSDVVLPAAGRDGSWQGDGAFLHRDGREIPVSMALLAHRGANGDVDIFYTVSRDITERKRAEEALRLQSAALHAAADAIVITDRAGVIEWVNPAFTQLTGYTAEEALGKNPRDLVKSGKHAPAFFKDLWETILAGRTWHGEMINRRKDGSLYTEDQSRHPDPGCVRRHHALRRDQARHHRAPAARGPVPSGAEDGKCGAARQRHRARLQQPAHRDQRDVGARAGAGQSRRSGARGCAGDSPRRGASRHVDPPAAGLQPPADPGATGAEPQHGGRGDGESAPASARRGHRPGGRADTRRGSASRRTPDKSSK